MHAYNEGNMSELGKNHVQQIDAFLGADKTALNVKELREEMESDGFSLESGYRELLAFVFCKQHKALVDKGDLFVSFFSDLHRDNQSDYMMLTSALGTILGVSFISAMAKLVSVMLDLRGLYEEAAAKGVAYIEAGQNAVAISMAFLTLSGEFKAFFETYDLPMSLHAHNIVKIRHGDSVVERWREYRLACHIAMLNAEVNAERVRRVSAMLMLKAKEVAARAIQNARQDETTQQPKPSEKKEKAGPKDEQLWLF